MVCSYIETNKFIICRAAGLNQNKEQTNKLLQKLMVNCKLQQSGEVYRSYFSGVLKISKYTLKTLDIACQNFEIPKSPGVLQMDSPKATLLKLLLADKNLEVLQSDIIAKVLVSLVLKQYPNNQVHSDIQEAAWDELEKIYITTNFESNLLLIEDTTKNVPKEPEKVQVVQVVNTELLEELQNLLCTLSVELLNKSTVDNVGIVKNLLTIVILYTNVISYMLLYGILSENLKETCLYTELQQTLTKLSSVFFDFCEKLNGRKRMGEMKCVLNMFEKLFDVNITSSSDKLRFSYLLRELLPIEILQQIFILRNKEIEENEDGKKDLRGEQ